MKSDRFYLEVAIKEAEEAFNHLTYPVGAVIIDPTGEIIGRGHNQVYSSGDFTSHAEVEAIRAASGKLMLEQNYEKCTLYTTLEPCFMCCGAIFHARIARVVWVSDDVKFGAFRPFYDGNNDKDKAFYDYFNKYFTSFDACKYKGLKLERSEYKDLWNKMEDLMSIWNNKKEKRLELWRCGNAQE